ncbi:F-box protein At2g21930-like [Triticum aestivum]|uniref:F-box protein At2g21930-like n=1 Tax=Triticum aestivum TaxID=4565 RepID=UPI00194AA6C0|nr:F-box protein At2g21930-like [Triticum aestivum]
MEAKTEKERSLEKKTKSGLYRCNYPGATAEAAALFTDDLILEILSRLPARSLHRFKCVSLPWRDLIADPANRKKLPQTLAGFLYTSFCGSGYRHHFASVSGGPAPFDPSLPYLQLNKYKDMAQMDTCNGLVLYRGCTKKAAPWDWAEDDCRFVVCNPAIGKWLELPPKPLAPAIRYSHTAALAFDPAVSSHFHVLHFEEDYLANYMTGVSIYSSRTGAWSRRDSGMVEKAAPFFRCKCVFVGGMMYVIGELEDISTGNEYVVVGVDVEGKEWKTIRVPYCSRFCMIGLSQGCLHYAVATYESLVPEITLWCLKDCNSKEFVLKHTASMDMLLSMTRMKYRVVGIHPDCDTIFLFSYGGATLATYDMRHQKVGCILNLENMNSTQRFLPYVPLFSEPLADADGQ